MQQHNLQSFCCQQAPRHEAFFSSPSCPGFCSAIYCNMIHATQPKQEHYLYNITIICQSSKKNKGRIKIKNISKTLSWRNGASRVLLFLAARHAKPNIGGAKEFLHQKPYGFFHQIKFDAACFKTPIFFYFYQPRLLQRP